jgi:HK97 gp10 family phage protein
MKAGGGVIVTGFEELDKALGEFPAKVQKAMARKGTRKAAKDIVLPDAINRVPVDTGDLEESLTVRTIKRSRGKIGHMVTTKEGFFKGDQFYGAMVEFGTKERTHKSTGKSVGAIQPHYHSFLRPALYENRDKIQSLFADVLRAEIRTIKSWHRHLDEKAAEYTAENAL